MPRLLLPFAIAALLAAAPAGAQLGQSDCSLARSEIDRDRCYQSNRDNAERDSVSRKRIEQHLPNGSGGEAGAGYEPTPQEREALEYWRQRTERENAERHEAEQRYRQSDEYKDKMEALAEDSRQYLWRVRQLFAAYPEALRFPTPIKATLRNSNSFLDLDKNKGLAEFIRTLFPDIGKEMLKRSRSGYWNHEKIGRYCSGRSGTEGELLGLLGPNDRGIRAGIFTFECQGERFYEFQAMSPHADNTQTLYPDANDYAAALAAAGVPEAQRFPPDKPLSPPMQRDADCRKGSLADCVARAEELRGMFPPKLDEARSYVELTCTGERADGCGLLAEWAYQGIGAAASTTQALELAQRACDTPGPSAARGCGVLGTLYLRGHGVDRSYGKALPYLRRACDGDSVLGCVALAQMYDEGRGVVRDPAAAKRSYARACGRGDADACQRQRELEG